MSQRESYTVYPRNPVDEMDLTLISGPTAPTSLNEDSEELAPIITTRHLLRCSLRGKTRKLRVKHRYGRSHVKNGVKKEVYRSPSRALPEAGAGVS